MSAVSIVDDIVPAVPLDDDVPPPPAVPPVDDDDDDDARSQKLSRNLH